MKDYTKTHINALSKVDRALQMRQTMTHKQILFTQANQDKLDQVRRLIYQAIDILQDVK